MLHGTHHPAPWLESPTPRLLPGLCGGGAQLTRGVSACAQGLDPVAESTAELELRLRWAEETRLEAEKRRVAREQAIAEARARGDGACVRGSAPGM